MSKKLLVLLVTISAVVSLPLDKVIGPDGKEARPGDSTELGGRWGHHHGYGGYYNNYYSYPSYSSYYYYPSYGNWYYRDGKPVPAELAPPKPDSPPEKSDAISFKEKRAAGDEKVISPDGKEGVKLDPTALDGRWGHHGGYRRHSYYHYPSYGNAGYYYPSYNRWYYRDGKPVPEDKAPPAPVGPPEDAIAFPSKTKRAAEDDKVIGPDGKEARPGDSTQLGGRWGHNHGYGGYYNNYYSYPSYSNYYYYPSYGNWYYRDGKPVPADLAPPKPNSPPEKSDAISFKEKRAAGDEKVISPDGKEGVKLDPTALDGRWGHHGGYHRHSYYHYPSYGNAGYYYPSYNRWYYRDGKPVPEDKAPPAPVGPPSDAVAFPTKN